MWCRGLLERGVPASTHAERVASKFPPPQPAWRGAGSARAALDTAASAACVAARLGIQVQAPTTRLNTRSRPPRCAPARRRRAAPGHSQARVDPARALLGRRRRRKKCRRPFRGGAATIPPPQPRGAGGAVAASPAAPARLMAPSLLAVCTSELRSTAAAFDLENDGAWQPLLAQ